MNHTVINMLRLADALDQQGQHDLADRFDAEIRWFGERVQRQEPPQEMSADPVEWAGKRFLAGWGFDRIANEMGFSSIDNARMMVNRFIARHPEHEPAIAHLRRKETPWEEIREVGQKVESGMTVSEVAAVSGMNENSVRRYYDLFRERFPDETVMGRPIIRLLGRKALSDKEAERASDLVADMHFSGMTFEQIGERLEKTPEYIHQLYREHYLPRHPEIPSVWAKDELLDTAREIARLYLEGVPATTICQQLGLKGWNNAESILVNKLPPEELAILMNSRRHGGNRLEQTKKLAEIAGRMRLELYDNPKIARELGVHKLYVGNLLKMFVAIHPELAHDIERAKLILSRNRRGKIDGAAPTTV